MEAIYEWLLERPQWLIDGGRGLCLAGFVLLFAGLWSQMVTTAVSAVSSLTPGTMAQPTKTLSEIYPALPTWWIPESLLGTLLALALIILGIIVAMTGKQYKRMLD